MMEYLHSFNKERVTVYCLFLGISTGLSSCCALTCALDPLCEPLPFLIKCHESDIIEKQLPIIPDSVQFDSGNQSETAINNLQESTKDSLARKVKQPHSETSVNLESDESDLSVMEELEKYANPAIPLIHLGIGPSFFAGKKVDGEKDKPLPGLEIGARWNFRLTSQLSFTPGIQYRSIGNKNIEESEVNDYYYYHVYRFEEIQRLNYIDFLPFLSYHLTPRFFLAGGPSLSFLTGAKTRSKSEHSSRKERTTNGWNRWNIAGNIQGYYQPLNSFFGFGLNYNHGFSNVWNTDAAYTPPGDKDKKYNRSITMVVLYKLPQASYNYKRNRRNVASVMSAEENKRRDAERKRRYEEEKRNPKGTNTKM